MAGLNGAGAAISRGILSPLARRQYGALAAMRWAIFRNAMRSSMGAFEIGARTITYLIYGATGLAMSVGVAVGAYAMIATDKMALLPLLYWAVFLIWQLLPVMLASFQEQFDLSVLLRFPVGFGSYFLLFLLFGLVDVSTITGGLCTLGLWVGITAAEPSAALKAALGLAVFSAFNIVLTRAVFAWIDRWLAQRRTREILGGVFLLGVLAVQAFNPALYRSRHEGRVHRREHMAEQQRRLAELRPWLEKADAVQRWLPPGLAARMVQASRQPEILFESTGMLAAYALAAGVVLGARLRSEYAGESLGEAPANARPAARTGHAPDSTTARAPGAGFAGARPVAAVIEKELRVLLRTMPLLYAVGAPLILVLVFSGVFIRNGPQTPSFPLALPVCLVYAQLGFTQLFYNNLGAEGAGVQLYFLSPTPMGTVLLGKNIFHAALFALVAATATLLATLRLGVPQPAVLAASGAWLLFALPANLLAGNIFSLTMPYRVNPGRLTRQRGSQANALLSLLVQAVIIAIGAVVFAITWWTGRHWVAAPVFLALSGVAWFCWRMGLRKAGDLAARNKDELLEKLAKTG